MGRNDDRNILEETANPMIQKQPLITANHKNRAGVVEQEMMIDPPDKN